MSMESDRTVISAALTAAGCKCVLMNKDNVPKELPAGIITMESEDGRNGTSRRYVSTDISWTVYLIVNAHNADDPDADLYALKELLRAELISRLGRDIPHVEYYTSRVDGSRLVRVARLDLLKSGTGAGS